MKKKKPMYRSKALRALKRYYVSVPYTEKEKQAEVVERRAAPPFIDIRTFYFYKDHLEMGVGFPLELRHRGVKYNWPMIKSFREVLKGLTLSIYDSNARVFTRNLERHSDG